MEPPAKRRTMHDRGDTGNIDTGGGDDNVIDSEWHTRIVSLFITDACTTHIARVVRHAT